MFVLSAKNLRWTHTLRLFCLVAFDWYKLYHNNRNLAPPSGGDHDPEDGYTNTTIQTSWISGR